MGAIKTGVYTKAQESLAGIAKALGHPARIGILQELGRRQRCQCGQLAARVGLAQSTMSQHLKELKNAGIVKDGIDGSKSCYCCSPESLVKLMNFLNQIISTENRQLVNRF